MKILLAFDSFKGCLSAPQACEAAALGVRRACPDAEVVQLPLSDGGEGMVECLVRALGLQWVEAEVHDPLMRQLRARYAVSADGATAYIEMASAAGLPLLTPAERDPVRATTYGVGELLLDAVGRGCRDVVMGIGGSATCDAGQGMLQALEGALRLPLRITVACDVRNPLYGPEGAAYVFAPQKGATPQQVVQLDERLRRFAALSEAEHDVSPRFAHHPGAGAAGGLGYALIAYLGAELCSGIDLVLQHLCFDRQLEDAALVLTGEGCSDRQTLMGKVPQGVLQRSLGRHVPVHLLSGGISDADALLQAGFASVRSINASDSRPLSVLLQPQVASANLAQAVAQVVNNHLNQK